MATKKLTSAFMKTATANGKEREVYWDAALPSFGLMVTERGAKSYVVQYRHNGRSRRYTIGVANNLDLDAARKRARAVLGQVAQGQDPVTEKKRAASAGRNTLRAICEAYLAREGKNLRSADNRRSALERLVYPKLGDRQINAIGRRDIVHLLDKIEDEKGPDAANSTLAFTRAIFNWHATRDDDFVSPIVKGMARQTNGARERVLSDDELKTVWLAAEKMDPPWGHYVRFLLLTACRRNEAAQMTWSEVKGDLWTIPAERYKSDHDTTLPLSKAAMKVLGELPRISGTDFVFTSSGRVAIGGFTQFKLKLDLASGVKNWRLHDLRRTARSLLSRAGANSDIAERCLGHKIGGIRGVYDRHRYLDEMRQAFERLAAQIESLRCAND
jgi:integrase